MTVHTGTIRVCPQCGCEHKFRYVPVEVANDLERELERLREAARVAVDDLYKAANQFAGLRPDGNNARRFTDKAERLRAALDESR